MSLFLSFALLLTGPQLGYVISCQGIINTLQYSRYIYSSVFCNLPQALAVLGHIRLLLSGILEFHLVTPPFVPVKSREAYTCTHVPFLFSLSL